VRISATARRVAHLLTLTNSNPNPRHLSYPFHEQTEKHGQSDDQTNGGQNSKKIARCVSSYAIYSAMIITVAWCGEWVKKNSASTGLWLL